MRNDDRAEFVRVLSAVYAVHRAELSDGVLDLWWSAMQAFEIEVVKGALGRHVMNPDTGQFLPKPADVVRELGGTTQDKSMLAWAKVTDGLRRVGTYASVQFDDPIIHRVLVDLGGWTWLGQQRESELPFIEKRFRDAYRAWLHRGVSSVPAYLPGHFEITNNANGYQEHEPPVQIGTAVPQLEEKR